MDRGASGHFEFAPDLLRQRLEPQAGLFKEGLLPCAEDAECCRVFWGGVPQAVLEAVTGTETKDVTFLAGLIPLRFLPPELNVARGRQGFFPSGVGNISKFESLFHKEITGEEIPIVFNNKVLTAVLAHGADISLSCDQKVDNAVKVANADFARVCREPGLVDFLHECSPLFTADGEGGEIALVVEFNAGNVLVKEKSLIAEVAVDLPGSFNIRLTYEHQDIKFYGILLQCPNSPKNIGMAAAACQIQAELVVDIGRTIKAHPEKKFISSKKFSKLVIDQGGVGLQAVGHRTPRTAILLLEFNRPLEEGLAHQGGFASLPAEGVLRLACLHVPPDHCLEGRIGHAVGLCIVKHPVFFEVETVSAAQVTVGARRLD